MNFKGGKNISQTEEKSNENTGKDNEVNEEELCIGCCFCPGFPSTVLMVQTVGTINIVNPEFFEDCVPGIILSYSVNENLEVSVGVVQGEDGSWYVPECTFMVPEDLNSEFLGSEDVASEVGELQFKVLLNFNHEGDILPPFTEEEFDFSCYTVKILPEEIDENGKLKEESALDYVLNDEVIFVPISDVAFPQTPVLFACLAELKSHLSTSENIDV